MSGGGPVAWARGYHGRVRHGPGQVSALDAEGTSPQTLTDMSARQPSESIAATPARMLPLLVIVPVVVAAVRLGRPHYLETPTISIGFAVLCAVVLGWPALFWALDHARTRLAHLTTLGVVVHVGPAGVRRAR